MLQFVKNNYLNFIVFGGLFLLVTVTIVIIIIIGKKNNEIWLIMWYTYIRLGVKLMKLKFRATSKDYLIFVIFAVVLLYFVAIAVLNISSFATDGTFHGVNPIPAFTGDLLVPTIVGYFFALVFIFTPPIV